MSAPYQHRCGAHVDATIEYTGSAYAVAFYSTDTGARTDYCPGCGAELAVALRDGQLSDESGHRPRDRHPSEAAQ